MVALAILLVELGIVVAGGALGYYLIEVPARRAIVATAQGWRSRRVEAEESVTPAAPAS